MNLQSLKESLSANNIDVSILNINGEGNSPEGFVIFKMTKNVLLDSSQGPKKKILAGKDLWWEVFYGERGHKFDLKNHYDESSACQDFFTRVTFAAERSPEDYLKNYNPPLDIET